MVFQFIGETVKNATDVFVEPAASNLMLALQMVLLTGVTLYITLTGYAISTGAVESSFWTFVKQCIKIIIIAFFALTVDGYIGGVMNAISGLEEGLAQAMNKESGAAPVSIYETLDKSLNKGFESVGTCFERADDADSIGSALGWVIAGVVVAIGTVLVALLGGAVVIVAKFSLAIMFALGPLFIAALMFPATARFFDSWFSQVMNYVVTIVIIAIVMTFAMEAFDEFINGADFSGDDESNPMFVALQIAAVTGVLCWIILQATGMASGLAGGISMAAMSVRHLMSPISGSLKAAKTAGNIVNPMTTRRDMQSGMMVTARRANHLLAGNTVLNPAYRQHVMQNLGKNWGRATGGSIKEASTGKESRKMFLPRGTRLPKSSQR
jgi:type IV secretion system protein VirB6